MVARRALPIAILAASSWLACAGPGGTEAPPDLPDIMSLEGPASLEVGQTGTMKLTLVDASGRPVTPPPVAWSSSALSVVTVAGNGSMTAVGPGQVKIGARAGDLAATASVTVSYGAATHIVISGPAQLQIGSSATMTAIGINVWGGAVAPSPVTWTSSIPGIAEITPSGMVTGIATGQTIINAMSGSLAAATTVQVTPVPGNVYLAIMPEGEYGDTIVLAPGQPLAFTAYLYSSGFPGQYVTAAAALWTSSQAGVAAVDSSGRVTAIAPGTTDIRASANSHDAVLRIRVAATPGSVSVRLIHAGAGYGPVTLQPSTGPAVSLAFGEFRDLTLPAGTLQLHIAGYTLFVPDYFDPAILDIQQFTGFLPDQTHATFVVVANSDYAFYSGALNLAPLWQDESVFLGHTRVRVMLATVGGYNVYFVPTGGAMGTLFLRGCYLDWPYGVTAWADAPGGSFDIVLEPKWQPKTEAARFHVTPQAGSATTYVLAGQDVAHLQLLTYLDH